MPRLDAEQATEIAKHYILMKNIKQALAYCQAAIEQDQTYYIAYLFKAYCHINLRQYEIAINCLKDLLSKKPSNTTDNAIIHDGHLWLGYVYSRVKNHQCAIMAFKLATEVHSNNPDIYFYLGRELLLNNNYKNAFDVFKKAKELRLARVVVEDFLAGARELSKGVKDHGVNYDKLLNTYNAELQNREDHIDFDSNISIVAVKKLIAEIGDGKSANMFDDLAALLKLFNIENDEYDREVNQINFANSRVPLQSLPNHASNQLTQSEEKQQKPILRKDDNKSGKGSLIRQVSFLFSGKEKGSSSESPQAKPTERDAKSKVSAPLSPPHPKY